MNTKLATFDPLPIRMLAGAAFIAHGMPKFANPAGTAGFFASVGIPGELAIPAEAYLKWRAGGVSAGRLYDPDNFDTACGRDGLCRGYSKGAKGVCRRL
jgi:hypothetical protein